MITAGQIHESMLESRRNSLVEVDVLLAAGWRFELPEIVNRKHDGEKRMSTEPWQWYWRSPPKRKGSKGRKYWSTTMAFNALKRQHLARECEEAINEKV